MHDLAKDIIDGITPMSGWRHSSSEARLFEAVMAMLEDMDPDTVDECVWTIAATMEEEYSDD